MTWAICLLERHREAWSRMVTEVDLALGGRTPQFHDLVTLPYTRAVLEETLRLRPALWAIPRMATRADEVGGFRVPQGDIVTLVPYVTHRHPDFWVDLSNPSRRGSCPRAELESAAGPTSPSAQDNASALEWTSL